MLEILNYRLGYIGDATVSEKRVPTTFSLAWGILKEDTPISFKKARTIFPLKPVLFLPFPNTYHYDKNSNHDRNVRQ